MDPQTGRDRQLGSSHRRQWRDGPAIGRRLRLGAVLFVLGLTGFFTLAYFFGVGVD
jgi:hypothetical protein